MAVLRAIVLAFLAASCALVPASAQEVPDTVASPASATRPSRRALCFRGSPLPSCRVFLITEVAYHLHEDRPEDGLEAYVSWSFGGMVNVSGRDALGVAMLRSRPDDDPDSHGRTGWVARYRRWLLPNRLAADLSFGRIGTADGDPEAHRYVADFAFTLADYVGVFGRAFGSPEGAHPSGGVKLGSWPAVVAGVASVLLVAMVGAG